MWISPLLKIVPSSCDSDDRADRLLIKGCWFSTWLLNPKSPACVALHLCCHQCVLNVHTQIKKAFFSSFDIQLCCSEVQL